MGNTPNILNRIFQVKRQEVEELKKQTALRELEETVSEQPYPQSLSEALAGDSISLIAEAKKASPSKGLLAPNFDPVGLAHTYVENGASAISVLTETPHFQGSLEHMKAIKDNLGGTCPPVLRKDFLFDEYQIYESRVCRSDALLLIAAILNQAQIAQLISLSRQLGMECLVEVHNEREVEIALCGGAEIIGINNRDLTTFEVDLDTTRRLRPLIPDDKLVVAESGIFTAEDVAKLEGWGANAILVGEALITASDVAGKVRELARRTQAKMRDD